jgi:hypothetical protein
MEENSRINTWGKGGKVGQEKAKEVGIWTDRKKKIGVSGL